MGELLAATLEIIAVFGLDGILDGTGNGVVDTQDGTLHQLHLSGRVTTQATTSTTANAATPTGSLSLAPGLCGRSLTAGIGGSDSTGNTKGGGGVIKGGFVRVNGTGAVGIVVRGTGGVGFGQTVAGGGTSRGHAALVGIVKGTLAGEQAMSSFFLLATILDGQHPGSWRQSGELTFDGRSSRRWPASS